MRRSLALAGMALALSASVATTSAQQANVQVGVLECRGGASVGFIVGSVTNLGCVMRAAGRPDDFYVATIRKVGLDLGITHVMILRVIDGYGRPDAPWTVFTRDYLEREAVGSRHGIYRLRTPPDA